LQGKNANDEIEELRIEIGKWSIENAANLGKLAFFIWKYLSIIYNLKFKIFDLS